MLMQNFNSALLRGELHGYFNLTMVRNHFSWIQKCSSEARGHLQCVN